MYIYLLQCIHVPKICIFVHMYIYLLQCIGLTCAKNISIKFLAHVDKYLFCFGEWRALWQDPSYQRD